MWYSIIGPSKEVIIEPVVLESFFPHKLTGRWRENQPGGSSLQKEPKTPKVPQRLPSLDFPRTEPIPNPNFLFFFFCKIYFPKFIPFSIIPGSEKYNPNKLVLKRHNITFISAWFFLLLGCYFMYPFSLVPFSYYVLLMFSQRGLCISIIYFYFHF